MPEQTDTKKKCASCGNEPAGPVREGGGNNGAGNMSPGSASRTGGATSGVPRQEKPKTDAS